MADEPFEDLNKSQDKFAQNFKESLDFLRDAITSMGQKLSDVLKDAINQNNNLEDSTRRVAKLYTNDITKGLDKITNSLDDQSDLTTKISKGIDITKEIEKEREKIEKETEKIKRRINSLAGEGIQLSDKDLENIKAKIQAAKISVNLLENENKERVKSLGLTGRLLEGLDEILREVGGKKLADILNIEGATRKTRELNNVTPLSSFGKLSNITKNIGQNLISGIKGIDPLSLIIGKLIEAVIHADKAIGEMAKSLGFSYEQASKLKGELTDIAASSADAFVTTENLQKQFLNINDALGTTIKLNEDDLITMTQLAERAGVSSEVIGDIYKLSKLNGKSFKDTTEEIEGQIAASNEQNKISSNYKKVLTEVGKTSAVIQLSLKGSVSQITDAIIKARALGASLEQVDKIAGSLLDFESSIASEIEAELITGKQLNLERARAAALNNDLATLSEEIKNNIGSTAEFSQMNRIAQESIAKAMGLTREELADILKQQDLLSGTIYSDISKAQEDYNRLLEEGYSIEEAKAKIGNTALADQLASVTMQEEFNQTLAKMQEIFVSLAKPILAILKPLMDVLSPILSILTNVVQNVLSPALNVISKSIGFILSPLQKISGTFGGIGDKIGGFVELIYKGIWYPIKITGKALFEWLITPLKSIFGIFGGISKILKGDFKDGFEQIGKSILKYLVSPLQYVLDIIIGMVNGVIKAINFFGGNIKELKDFKIISEDKEEKKEKTLEGDDVVSPGYGKRVLFTPEGSIRLNDKDSVLAGTQLNKDKESIKNIVNKNINQNYTKNTNNQNILNKTINDNEIVGFNNNDIVNHLKTLQTLLVENNKLLRGLLDKEGIINMDGQKVGDVVFGGSNGFAL